MYFLISDFFFILNSTEHEISTAQKILKYRQIKGFLVLSLSDDVFNMLINIKTPTIVNNCWHFNIYKQDKFYAQLS